MTNNNPTFGARLELNSVTDFIPLKEAKMLKQKAAVVGSSTTVLRVSLKNNLKRCIINRDIYNLDNDCFVLEGLSYHKGRPDSEDLAVLRPAPNASFFNIQNLNFMKTKTKRNIPSDKSSQSMTEIVSKWLDSLAKKLK